MKLGEALTLRAKQAQRMAALSGRLRQNALVQEGDEPSENPKHLMEELEQVIGEHYALVVRINRTNVETGLMAKLQERAKLSALRNMYATAAAHSVPQMRYGRQEIKMVPVLNAADLNEKAEELDERIRVLDAEIQEKNWQTDLVG